MDIITHLSQSGYCRQGSLGKYTFRWLKKYVSTKVTQSNQSANCSIDLFRVIYASWVRKTPTKSLLLAKDSNWNQIDRPRTVVSSTGCEHYVGLTKAEKQNWNQLPIV